MPHSIPSSSASAHSLPPAEALGGSPAAKAIGGRLAWRPSRWLVAALLAMTPLAAGSVLVSEMPRLAAWPLALAAVAYGGWLAHREWRRPRKTFVFPYGDAPVLVDGRPVTHVALQWRGPLAFLRWRDETGRLHRVAWWPDTLPASRRRELRLAAAAREAAPGRASMAP